MHGASGFTRLARACCAAAAFAAAPVAACAALAATPAPVQAQMQAPASVQASARDQASSPSTVPALPMPDAEAAALRGMVAALHDADGATLAGKVDFSARFDEQLQRGQSQHAWDDLDDMGRLLERQSLARAWTLPDAAWMRDAEFVAATSLPDPDAGLGPVPDRRLAQVVLRNPVTGELRDLLCTLTPSFQLIDLRIGVPYFPGANPLGAAGLQPAPGFAQPTRPGVVWPEEVRDGDREESRKLVSKLLASRDGPDRDLFIDRLHRSPLAGVAAVLERLADLDRAAQPDAPIEATLDAVLERITGRSSELSAQPRHGATQTAWRDINHRAVLGWLAWHERSGAHFTAAPAVDLVRAEPRTRSSTSRPPSPTGAMPADEGEPPAGAGSTSGGAPLAGGPAAAGAGSAPGTGSPPGGGPPAGAGTARGAEPTAPATAPGEAPVGGASPGGAPPVDGGATAGAAAPGDGPAGGDGLDGPTVKLGVTAATKTPRELLYPAAAALHLRYAGHDAIGRQVEPRLSPAVKEALNAWAEPAARLGFNVVLSGTSDAIAMGPLKLETLQQAVDWMDEATVLLDPIVGTAAGRESRATVAMLFDEQGAQSPAWNALLDELVTRRLVFETVASGLRTLPAGLMLRGAGLFLQTTYDVAGNKDSGDDEFRLRNEVLHKLTQCLVTARCGQLPPQILWGLGLLVEFKFTHAMYMLNTTGFVASGDHGDWPTRTKQMLEKRQGRKRAATLSSHAMDDAAAGKPIEAQMCTWAALSWMADRQPARLKDLLLQLADLHAAADPSGRSSVYRGDPVATEKTLAQGFDSIDLMALMEWLTTNR